MSTYPTCNRAILFSSDFLDCASLAYTDRNKVNISFKGVVEQELDKKKMRRERERGGGGRGGENIQASRVQYPLQLQAN